MTIALFLLVAIAVVWHADHGVGFFDANLVDRTKHDGRLCGDRNLDGTTGGIR